MIGALFRSLRISLRTTLLLTTLIAVHPRLVLRIGIILSTSAVALLLLILSIVVTVALRITLVVATELGSGLAVIEAAGSRGAEGVLSSWGTEVLGLVVAAVTLLRRIAALLLAVALLWRVAALLLVAALVVALLAAVAAAVVIVGA